MNTDIPTGTPASAENSPDRLLERMDLPAGGLELNAYLRRVEDRLVRQALVRARGVIAHAALMLGLRRTTLAERLRKSRARAAMPASAGLRAGERLNGASSQAHR